VLERAYALREAIYHIFSASAARARPAADDLEALNQELKPALAQGRVVVTAEGFDWAWGTEMLCLDQMLPPLARGAATLLTSEERSRVRQCASPTCGWLFVDSTKNHRRQWCSMTGCGNKARVRRHRQRQRASSS
jgi:predicted RNA-binding Zn ribbon-like protein